VVERSNKSWLSAKYSKLHYTDWAFIHRAILQKEPGESASKIIAPLYRSYCLILDTVKLVRSHQEQSNTGTLPWQALIENKQLDYEVRLSETLHQLTKLQLPNKISSDLSDEYYTESGRNAFNNYTRSSFENYLNHIHAQHPVQQVLDVGCGYGNYLNSVNEVLPDSRITGIEMQEKVYHETLKRFKKIEAISLIHANVFDAELPQNIDLILFNYVLFYFSTAEKIRLFKHLSQHLSDNGSILVCQYYTKIEALKEGLAKRHNKRKLSNRIEQYIGNKILYANSLWNESSDAFVQAENWDEFLQVLDQTGFKVVSMTNADHFYYSLFLEIKKK